MSLISREVFVREALRMRAEGKLIREIAEHFGVAIQTASTWISDPDLSKQRARRKRYQGSCENCGAATDGSAGAAKAPKLCRPCFDEERTPDHGTVSRYRGGCRCKDCRTANREHHRSLKAREAPTHGTQSGYGNYGCRCRLCRDAHNEWQRQHPEYRWRWEAKVRGTEPPRHGYSTAYSAYGCRCHECRAWAAAYWQERQAKRKTAA